MAASNSRSSEETGASDPAGSYYVLGDPLGSVREVLDSTGDVKDSVAYDGFGQIQPGELDAAYRGWYAFTGRQHDIEIDLQYNNARWYDPKMDRWIGNDPLGFDAGDSNLSRYVNNRPTLFADPSGLQPSAYENSVFRMLDKEAKMALGRMKQYEKQYFERLKNAKEAKTGLSSTLRNPKTSYQKSLDLYGTAIVNLGTSQMFLVSEAMNVVYFRLQTAKLPNKTQAAKEKFTNDYKTISDTLMRIETANRAEYKYITNEAKSYFKRTNPNVLINVWPLEAVVSTVNIQYGQLLGAAFVLYFSYNFKFDSLALSAQFFAGK